jgi:hypothetical protein
MTDQDMNGGGSGRKGRDWAEETRSALDKATEAIRSAWDATRDTRVSALESARKAVGDLAEVIDQGVAVAKERWAETEHSGATAPEESAEEE